MDLFEPQNGAFETTRAEEITEEDRRDARTVSEFIVKLKEPRYKPGTDVQKKREEKTGREGERERPFVLLQHLPRFKAERARRCSRERERKARAR